MAMSLPGAACEDSNLPFLRECLSTLESLDAESGIRDRVEIYNIPSKHP